MHNLYLSAVITNSSQERIVCCYSELWKKHTSCFTGDVKLLIGSLYIASIGPHYITFIPISLLAWNLLFNKCNIKQEALKNNEGWFYVLLIYSLSFHLPPDLYVICNILLWLIYHTGSGNQFYIHNTLISGWIQWDKRLTIKKEVVRGHHFPQTLPLPQHITLQSAHNI